MCFYQLLLAQPLASSVGRMLSLEFKIPELKAIPISKYNMTWVKNYFGLIWMIWLARLEGFGGFLICHDLPTYSVETQHISTLDYNQLTRSR